MNADVNAVLAWFVGLDTHPPPKWYFFWRELCPGDSYNPHRHPFPFSRPSPSPRVLPTTVLNGPEKGGRPGYGYKPPRIRSLKVQNEPHCLAPSHATQEFQKKILFQHVLCQIFHIRHRSRCHELRITFQVPSN
jgi:hypothetical protein